jgi:hypothetical protein
MNKIDKDTCKAMIRQAMEDYTIYNGHNRPRHEEKTLFLNGMLAVLDWMPIEAHRRFKMKMYCYDTMSRLLGI